MVVKIGREEPVASMDASGKIVWAHHTEIQTVNVKSLGPEFAVADGERLPLAVKDLGACDLYPQSLAHSPNGRFVVVCGDGEYVVYTALAWRNKAFGSALEFVWSPDSNDYAIREAGNKARRPGGGLLALGMGGASPPSLPLLLPKPASMDETPSSSRPPPQTPSKPKKQVKQHKNFVEKGAVKLDFAAEGLHGGALIGVRAADFVCFYDWAEGRCVRRVDVEGVKSVHWSETGEQVAVVSESSFFLLRFDRAAMDAAFATGEGVDEDGARPAPALPLRRFRCPPAFPRAPAPRAPPPPALSSHPSSPHRLPLFSRSRQLYSASPKP